MIKIQGQEPFIGNLKELGNKFYIMTVGGAFYFYLCEISRKTVMPLEFNTKNEI